MKRLILALGCVFPLCASAQTSTLNADINIVGESEKGYSFYLLREKDTVHSVTGIYWNQTIVVDSLQPGPYTAYLYEQGVQGYVMRKFFEVEQEKSVRLDMTYQADVIITDRDNGLVDSKTEFQLGAGYFHSPWTDPDAILRGNFSAHYTVSAWLPFSKHAGVLIGSGFGASQHYFHKDMSLFDNIPFQKVFERYSSFTMNYELKLRFSTGDQRSDENNSHKLFVDIGANYNLPIVFNHTAMYRGSKKLIERDIHKFTDFRAFVNIGYAPVSVFLEYRLSDFIKKDLYPQIPRFNAGIKIMIGD